MHVNLLVIVCRDKRLLSKKAADEIHKFFAGLRRAYNLVWMPYLDFGAKLFCQNRSINPRKLIRIHFDMNKNITVKRTQPGPPNVFKPITRQAQNKRIGVPSSDLSR